MKKLALSLAVLFAVGMVSCADNKNDKACDDSAACDTAAVENVEGVAAEVTDSANGAADTTVVAEVAETPAAETPAEAPAK